MVRSNGSDMAVAGIDRCDEPSDINQFLRRRPSRGDGHQGGHGPQPSITPLDWHFTRRDSAKSRGLLIRRVIWICPLRARRPLVSARGPRHADSSSPVPKDATESRCE